MNAVAEVVYKAAGGKSMPAGRGIARAVSQYFANLDAGMRRSDAKLAEALFDPILAVLKREARNQLRDDDSLNPKDVARELVLVAKLRSVEVAASVNNTTKDLVEKGEADAYSANRAASIGITEASFATGASQEACLRLADPDAELEWECADGCCDECLSLKGKRVKVGEEFVSRGGTRVPHNPLHPNCNCACKRVRRA